MRNFDLDLLIKVCYLKYRDNISQKEIAKLLKLSTAKVSRILQKAFDLGIIQINILDLGKRTTNLERSLEKKYNLKRVLLVENQNSTPDDIKKRIGQRAANYLLNILKDGDCIGISHSSTVKECVSSLPMRIYTKVEVVQLLGGSYNLTFAELDATKELSDKFGVFPHILYAPLFVDNKQIRNAILSDSSIRRTFDYFKNVNVALVGIGKFHPIGSSTIFMSGDLTKEEIDELEKAGAVGDIFGHFINSDGDFCQTSIEERTITIPIEYIWNIEYRMGLAGGEDKFEAICSSIKKNIINILITDENVGKKLLDA